MLKKLIAVSASSLILFSCTPPGSNNNSPSPGSSPSANPTTTVTGKSGLRVTFDGQTYELQPVGSSPAIASIENGAILVIDGDNGKTGTDLIKLNVRISGNTPNAKFEKGFKGEIVNQITFQKGTAELFRGNPIVSMAKVNLTNTNDKVEGNYDGVLQSSLSNSKTMPVKFEFSLPFPG